jgi:hypothetical protein
MSDRKKPWRTWDDCASRYHQTMSDGETAMLRGADLAEGRPSLDELRQAAAKHAEASVLFSKAARISMLHIGHPEPFWEPTRRIIRKLRAWWSR